MRSERIEFAGAGGTMLAARLDRPEGAVRAAALFAHCFTCSKDIAAARRIAGALAARSIATMRFDFTGLGHSGGEFANTDFSSNIADLGAAAAWMAENGLAPQLLIGHSLGGAAVLAAAPGIAGVRAVATLNAPADPAHVLGNFGAALDTIAETGEATVSLAGRDFTIRRDFVEDVREAKLTEALGRLKAALLVLHAPRDAIVGIDNARRIFAAAKHPKSFVALDAADHLITAERDADYAAGVIAAWSTHYLDLADPPAPADAPEGVVRVAEAEGGGFRQDISVEGRHALVADEPAAMGGTDRGPSPYQYLAAALGACTTMTLRIYARRKELALAHVACDVSHDRRHAEDCADCENPGARIDVFTRRIRLEGDLSAEDRADLLRIADRCPVHRTLEAQARIETELAG
ncbi:OsmC family protein [Pararhodobacter sp. SW119]|uniref:bifunctional alpha/beta hydrolase/OsmC family protein n=1 Tax=Pararhodobacter sp. SW119 TaxID=2780075 RepID=UPI001ADFFCBA|nr:OsmC family protein [Pararhodobacter sp. SW119]